MNKGPIVSVEFGICRATLAESVLVPVDAKVQELLKDMVKATHISLGSTLDKYEPSQDYGPDRKLFLNLGDPLAAEFQAFWGDANRPLDVQAMSEPQNITAYFCVLHHKGGDYIIGIRRATQFKAVLKARLLQFLDDSLKAVDDNVFKLDHDFDVIIEDEKVLINRITAFELLANIEAQVQVAAGENCTLLAQKLTFIDFTQVKRYVSTHKRAARVVAALSARTDLTQTTLQNLRRECSRSGVDVRIVKGQLVPSKGQEIAFLNLLDRRRYAIKLIDGKWEQYEAGSRKSAGIRQDNYATKPVGEGSSKSGA